MRDPLSRVQIRYKLPAAFVGVCLFAFGVGGYLISVSARDALEDEIRLRLRSESEALAQGLEAQLTLLGRRAEDFASDGYIRTQVERILAAGTGDARNRNVLKEDLLHHLRQNKFPLVQPLADLAICLRDGTPLLAVLELQGPDFTAALREGASRDTLWCSRFITDEQSGHRYFALVTPLYDMRRDNVPAALVFWIDVQEWLRPLEHEGVRVLVREDEGHAISVTDRTGQRIDVVGAPPVDALVHARIIPASAWTVRVAVDAQKAMLPVSGLQSRFLGAGLLIAFAALVLLFFPIRFLIRPLSAMSDAAHAIAEGDYSRRVDVLADDEIGHLAQSFNRMAAATQQRTGALERTARLLEHRGRELAIERDLLTTVVHSMQDAVLYYDRSGEVLLHNNAAAPLRDAWQREALHLAPRRCNNARATDRDCERCLHDHSLPTRECTVDIGERVYEILFTRIATTGGPEGTLLVARDITHRMRLDERQAHYDRLAVMGEVSAVMAHELNNPLAAISMFSQMMHKEIGEDSAYREHLDVILRNTESCKRTIRDLLSYARNGVEEEGECDLHDLLPDMLRFLRPLYEKSDVRLEVDFRTGDATLRCDEIHLRQVFVNIVINALQAMRTRGGRCVIRSFDAGDEGELLGVDITDDGPGIPDALRDIIFEPFYTSKATGEGTGLGLSISRRIVESYGGTLQLVSSRPGATVFRVLLPRRCDGRTPGTRIDIPASLTEEGHHAAAGS
ncbi:MAG: HAMP domain-containing protein [Bacteroidetes bacterium]|nr:HAMP domain-containing protein [Bacteroidota bacterium]